MLSFTTYSPTKIIQGKETISELANLVPKEGKVLIAYGGGSIKKNGVYDQVVAALAGHDTVEFAGIEANPIYETLMQTVELCRKEDVKFIVAVGGGSVVDGIKFVAAALRQPEDVDPWGLLTGSLTAESALPFGTVMTLPATGSECNPNAVISRNSTQEKLVLFTSVTHPVFSILDPETTYTLPYNQLRNGIVDTYVHVLEQYVTCDQQAPLQDRQAEAILSVLIDYVEPMLETSPPSFDARMILMDAATWALNTYLERGIIPDWATHLIGHELTALYGPAHAETLAVVWPAVVAYKFDAKREKLAQYGERVWKLQGTTEEIAKGAIEKTKEFFAKVGMPLNLSDYKINA